MMQSKILLVLSIVSAAILMSGVIQTSAMAYPQQKQGYSHHNKMMMQPGLYAFGTISSLQNDENGNPTWIVSGLWEGSLSMDNKTQGGGGNQSTTTTTTTTETGGLPNATFYSKFNMAMPNNSTTVYNGTATITMREGPVPNVPVSIGTMDNNVINIWADPTKLNNHFGNTAIFGIIQKLLTVEK